MKDFWFVIRLHQVHYLLLGKLLSILWFRFIGFLAQLASSANSTTGEKLSVRPFLCVSVC